MIKVFTRLIPAVLAAALLGGSVFLNAKIMVWEGEISAGHKEIDQGQPALDTGKAKLEAAKAVLAEGKAEYDLAHDNPFLVFVDKVFNGGKGFEDGRSKIAEDGKKVARGEALIVAAELKLATGELELYRGEEQLKVAKGARLACALGGIFFALLSIVLAFRRRTSRAPALAHAVRKKHRAA